MASVSIGTMISCAGCNKQFNSKNQLFRHLNQSAKTCLPPEEYADFLVNVLSNKREKIGVLYGYVPGTDYRFIDHRSSARNASSLVGIEGGQHAAWLVTQAIDRMSPGLNVGANDASESFPPWSANSALFSKINRSYGSISRESESVAQDPHTGAITEVLCTTAVSLFVDDEPNEHMENDTQTQIKAKTLAWVTSVNEQLDQMLLAMTSAHITPSTSPSEFHEWSPGRIRIFGRVAIPQKKFNAETDVTHRRVDYCFPADLLYVSSSEGLSQSALQSHASTLQEYCNSLPSFQPGSKSYSSYDNRLPYDNRPDENTLSYFYKMKQIMKRISTQVEELNDNDAGAVLEKEFHDAKRKKKKTKKRNDPENCLSNTTINTDDVSASRPLSSKRLLKRKRYHNFSPRILAHDFLAYRRVDRIFHRTTIRLGGLSDTDSVGTPKLSSAVIDNRPFIVISLTGDLFLQEQ